MQTTIKIFFVFAVLLLACLTSCKKDELAIIPTDRETISESLKPAFVFPEGENDFDQKFQQFDDAFKVQVIYKAVTDSIINIMIGNNTTKYERYTVDVAKDTLTMIADILDKYYFKYLNKDKSPVTGQPYYIFLAKDVWFQYIPAFPKNIFYYRFESGYSYKQNCLFALTPEQMTGAGKEKWLNGWGRSMLMNYIYSALAKEQMLPPKNFIKNVSPIPPSTGAGNLLFNYADRDNERYFRRLGFVDYILPGGAEPVVPKYGTNGYSNVTGAISKQDQEVNYFMNFVKFAMVYISDEQYNRDWIQPQIGGTGSVRLPYFYMNNYPKLKAQYDLTVNHMLNEYGIDLKAIAKGTDH